MRAYSQDLRDKVINAFDNGTSRHCIADIFGLSYETVRRWIHRYTTNGNYSSGQHIQKGRPAMFSDNEKLILFVKSHPDLTAMEVRDELVPQMSNNGFYGLLKRCGISYKKRLSSTQRGVSFSEKNISS